VIRRIAIALLFATIAGSAVPAGAVIQTPLPQLLPLPAPAPAPTPAPLPPPINPGYAPAPSSGLSPLLTQPGPVYQLPQPASPAYPPPQLPGPIDQQKMQAYSNSLYSRQIQQQLNAPDPQ
jgi:hypothetical protein